MDYRTFFYDHQVALRIATRSSPEILSEFEQHFGIFDSVLTNTDIML